MLGSGTQEFALGRQSVWSAACERPRTRTETASMHNNVLADDKNQEMYNRYKKQDKVCKQSSSESDK